jgi:hypothetical protein
MAEPRTDNEEMKLVERLRARTFSKWSSDVQAVEDFEDELATEAADTIARLVAERDEAREALKPFARLAAKIPEDRSDGDFEVVNNRWLRRARAALQGAKS